MSSMEHSDCAFFIAGAFLYVGIMAILGLQLFMKENNKMTVGDALCMVLSSWLFLPIYFFYSVWMVIRNQTCKTVWTKKEEKKGWK